uniref:Androglobin domain-containing protein n=1 Tax=Arion vulgaris TaxID=1028688 RepID=A0A0B7A9C8_9EUPU
MWLFQPSPFSGITHTMILTQRDLDLELQIKIAHLQHLQTKIKQQTKKKRNESVFIAESKPLSQASMHSEAPEAEFIERIEDTKVHKYIIQATVLQNSWPLSENSWRFVQTLKEMEKNEFRLSNRDYPQSVLKVEKVQVAGSKTKLKGTKEKAGKDKGQDGKGSRPSSQHFDITKPHWTLRVVVDATAGDDIEVKKDVERAEEIRAMKKAWEDAEPGRAAKALQSRLKYLNSHTIKLSQSEDFTEPVKTESVTAVSSVVTDSEVNSDNENIFPSLTVSAAVFFNESETSLTLEPPPSLRPKDVLEPVDITPFVRKTLPEPLYKDEEIIQKLLEKRQKEIADFKIFREEVEKRREIDKQNRNLAKMRQLEQYQALQTALDEARDRINIPREAIRQRFLEAERIRLEELANQEAAAFLAEQELRAAKGKNKSTAVKKKK